jgi:hypothetical protein
VSNLSALTFLGRLIGRSSAAIGEHSFARAGGCTGTSFEQQRRHLRDAVGVVLQLRQHLRATARAGAAVSVRRNQGSGQ